MSYKNLLYIKLKPDSRPIRWTLQMEATFYGSRATGIYVSRKFGLSHLIWAKIASIRAKRAKKCHIWCIFNRFSTKNSNFFKKLTPNLQNFRVFEKTQGPWEKNSSIWRKNSSFLASKLNEPVVTNYTRYHKRVKKGLT